MLAPFRAAGPCRYAASGGRQLVLIIIRPTSDNNNSNETVIILRSPISEAAWFNTLSCSTRDFEFRSSRDELVGRKNKMAYHASLLMETVRSTRSFPSIFPRGKDQGGLEPAPTQDCESGLKVECGTCYLHTEENCILGVIAHLWWEYVE